MQQSSVVCPDRAGSIPGKAALRSLELSRRKSGRRWIGALIALPVLVVLSGCTSETATGWMPSTHDTTNQTDRILNLWVGSWIAALIVGVLVWGLMLWCIVAYRRRRDDVGLPPQVRYHVPLEILYTIIPLIMIAVLNFFTYRDDAAIADTSAKPDMVIGVVGKQWSWDFNYLNDATKKDDDVFETGVQAQLDGKPGVEATQPTLYLPVGKRIEFHLASRDVIHSFWISAFLYKMDVIPGIDNKFQVIPQCEGTFRGKCAELCGEYHSEMLFNVKVVSQADYDAHMAALKAAGNVGQLDVNLGRQKTPEGGAVPGATHFVSEGGTN